MSYVVLARKWRPMRFEDLVGQEHVARTLANAIARGRVAHAFLFTGVRGVGKTTSARILAKTLNCMGAPGSPASDTPPLTPCLECPACLEISAGTDLDVREIDGASYTGVDDVRELQKGLVFRPARDRHKIIIVDEVHMLSINAWNAFLKTLEEPPGHVKFIFATTEVQKVPVTILSRVQRFDFKLISAQAIAQRLRFVLEAEGIHAEPGAVALLAREAAGSMRDAMSLLDQVIAWSGDEGLTAEGAARVLGVASHQILHDLARALLAGETERCLRIVGELANQGYDVVHVARDVMALLRDLVVAKVCRDPDGVIELPAEERADVLALAQRVDADEALRLHQGFSAGYDEVARSGMPRAALEMLLIRLARRPPLVPVDDLVARLAGLERTLRAAGAGGPARVSPREPRGRDEAPRGRAPAGPRPGDEGDAEPPPALEPPATVAAPVRLGVAVPSGAPAAAAASPPAPVEPEPDDPMTRWRRVVEVLREREPVLAACLEHAVPVRVSRELVELSWEAGSLFLDQVSGPGAADALAGAAHTALGGRPAVRHRTDGALAAGETAAVASQRERAQREQAARAQALAHPRLQAALEILGARVKDLRLPEV